MNKYCPLAIETMRGHLTQVRQGVRSTKIKLRPSHSAPEEENQLEKEESTCNDSVNELCIKVVHKSKLYTDDTGRFPVRARSGNQYIMIGYHSSNLILAEPFSSRKDKHRIAAYNAMMERLKAKGLDVDLQVMDNEPSKDFKQNMVNKWKVEYQLVPPDMHRRNAAERAISTFKSRLISWLYWLGSTRTFQEICGICYCHRRR